MDAGPTIQPDEYAGVLEQTDAGIRLALPRLAERLNVGEPSASGPEIDSEVVHAVGADLMESRARLVTAGTRIPFEGNHALHRRLNDLVNDIDGFAAMLVERHSS